jgi:hypothetical protein
MNDWKKVGLVVVAAVAMVLLVGAGGRSAAPDAQGQLQTMERVTAAPGDQVATAAADADRGPGCAESALH